MKDKKWYMVWTRKDSKGDEIVKYYGPFNDYEQVVEQRKEVWDHPETHCVEFKQGSNSTSKIYLASR